MRVPKLSQRTRIVGVTAAALLCTPAFGFIVFDPTVAANIVKEIKQSIQAVATAKATYATMQANLKNFTWKNVWRTAKATLMNESVQDTYGETAGWDTALNSNSPGAAQTAWNIANLQVSPGTYLSGQTPGNSSGLTSLAMIEAFDSSSPACLNAVGQYRDLQATNAAAQSALENDEFDTSSATNSEIEQLNLLNAADAEHLHEMQSQGALHACLVEQTTISNMAQRNAAALAVNDAATAQQERATNNANPAGESNTWQNYLP
jgi:hypothetical protein